MNRRDMIKKAGTAVAGFSLIGLNAAAADNPIIANTQNNKRKKVLVIGAHPDDPETAAGGTMVLLAQAGYEVVSVYMTKGERGIAGKSLQEAADIRVPEAISACKILGAIN